MTFHLGSSCAAVVFLLLHMRQLHLTRTRAAVGCDGLCLRPPTAVVSPSCLPARLNYLRPVIHVYPDAPFLSLPFALRALG